MPTFTLPPRQPAASSRLPLTLMSLDSWALVSITGATAPLTCRGS